MPPLGLLYLAGYLRERSSHEPFVLDAWAERLNDADIVTRLHKAAPDIIGITAMTHTLRDALTVARAAKRAFPQVPVVMGGPHPTLYPRETLALSGVDMVLAGEGERPLAMLLDAILSGGRLEEVPGLGWKKDGVIVVNDECWSADPLDDLPFPAFDAVPVERYGSVLAVRRPVMSMVTSRGCPYRCSFCDRPLLKGSRWRAHSAERVVAEMERLAGLGVREIALYDDTFTVDRQRVLDICRMKRERSPSLLFSVRTRTDLVDEDVLAALAAAGCVAMHYGIESGSPPVRERIGKGSGIEEAITVCDLTRRYGMETLAYFMIGNPGETPEDIAATERLIERLSPDYLHLTVLMPFPGTPIYREMLGKGRLAEDVWRRFAIDPSRDIEPPLWEEHLSRAQLLACRRRIYRRFYGRPGYILSQLRGVSSLRELGAKAIAGIRLLTMR